MSKWQGAHTPADGSVGLTVRLTPEEKDRLEQLRRAGGLTSKAQVIRAALDLLEILNTPGEFLLGGPQAVRRAWEEHPELVARAQRKWAGVGGPDADAGLPGEAPDGDQEGEEAKQ